jgi:negative regulator of flagellin synthesis FlgM
MSINGINRLTYINAYNSNRSERVGKIGTVKNSDTIEISSIGKNLNEYSINSDKNSAEKIAEIKSKIDSGTYKIDAKLTAKSMINIMKEDKS